jgi:hypothetical protein
VSGINQDGTAAFDLAKNAFELLLNLVHIDGSDFVTVLREAGEAVFEPKGIQLFHDQPGSA